MDSRSEDVIHSVLKDFVVGRTVFIITHSLSAAFLDLVTRIVVMDQGCVIADGSCEEIRKSPEFSRLLQGEMSPVRAA